MAQLDWESLLGLPLDEAQRRIREAGLPAAEVAITRAPRRDAAEGECRVVRAAPGRLTAAFFRVACGAKQHDEQD